MQTTYNFGPAAPFEEYVYGAARPGYGSNEVTPAEVITWCEFMQAHTVKAVCCLLAPEQLTYYDDLLGHYRNTYGTQHVCWVPIADFTLISSQALTGQILPFLAQNTTNAIRTVIHCSAGSGRTGHVLALWLSHRYGLDNADAIQAVRSVSITSRNPLEAVTSDNDRIQLDRLFSVSLLPLPVG